MKRLKMLAACALVLCMFAGCGQDKEKKAQKEPVATETISVVTEVTMTPSPEPSVITEPSASVESSASAEPTPTPEPTAVADTPVAPKPEAKPLNAIWEEKLALYRSVDSVKHLVFVQCQANSKAMVIMYEKDAGSESGFSEILTCDAFIGRNGCSYNKVEGDGCNPCGDFGVSMAFGILDKPDTTLEYLKVTDDLYWCDKPGDYYNKLVSRNDVSDIKGEHLLGCAPEYNYALAMDYNSSCEPDKGSAIFFHCKGKKTYTSGCVAVSQSDMLTVMKNFCANDRILVYPMY